MCRSLTLVFALAVAACGTPAESTSSTDPSYPAGFSVVENAGGAWGEGEAWVVPAQPRLSIGMMEGPAEYQLMDVAAAARLTDGRVMVVDRGSRTVRLFDPEGAFLMNLGGPGSGPGEFTNPGSAVVTPGDSMLVWDDALVRGTRFGPSGALLEVKSFDMAGAFRAVTPPLYPGRVIPLADGGRLVRLMEKSGKTPPRGSFRRESGILRLSPDLSALDTLRFFPGEELVTVEAPWGDWPIPPPLARTTLITAGGVPATVCIGEQEEAEVACWGPRGDGRVVRWNGEPGEITPEEVARWRGEIAEGYSLKLGEDDIRRMLDLVPIPAARPPYDAIILDSSGNLWVGTGPAGNPDEDGMAYLVFDQEGTLLGTVLLPEVRILEIGEDYLLGVSQDEMEIQYLHLYDILRTEEPS